VEKCRLRAPTSFRFARARSRLSLVPRSDELTPAASGVSVLQLEGVVKEFADADEIVRAVDDVTLAIEPGRVVAVYGPSGSGKTTLLLLAAALLPPDRGVVRFAGQDLAALRSSEVSAYQRRDVGFIYQSPHLITGVPAVENAAVKLLADGVSLRRARGVACEWLERLGLAHRLEHTPERLSGGERQRVAIARALATNPRLVLADEPTGDLDTRRGKQILELLAAVARERQAAVLIATHDPQGAAVADRVCRLRDGKLLTADAAPDPEAAPLPPVELVPGVR
jgi:putative ABC transport system ATP-binding protein